MAGFGQGLSDFLIGTSNQLSQVPRLSAPQLGLNQQVQGAAQQLLPQAQQGFNFAPIAEQARKQFQTQSIPTLAQRFGGMGQSRGGSDYLHALASAEAGLQGNLASLGSQYEFANQGRQQQLLMSLLGLGLQPEFENIFMPGQQGFLQSAGAGIGAGIGLAAGPGIGAAAGAGISGLGALLKWLVHGQGTQPTNLGPESQPGA